MERAVVPLSVVVPAVLAGDCAATWGRLDMEVEEPDGDMPAVTIAIEFVAAQSGGAERILEIHHPLSGGMCAGCRTVPTRYPCTAARIAELAKRRITKRDKWGIS
jgi:hypothetical protein